VLKLTVCKPSVVTGSGTSTGLVDSPTVTRNLFAIVPEKYYQSAALKKTSITNGKFR